MAIDSGAIGRAFSEHRFDDALGHLAEDVRWTIVGYMVLEGADVVRQTCRETAASLEDTTTTYDRCVVAAGSDVVAVDTFARYSSPSGLRRSPVATSTSSPAKRSPPSPRTPSRSIPTRRVHNRHPGASGSLGGRIRLTLSTGRT